MAIKNVFPLLVLICILSYATAARKLEANGDQLTECLKGLQQIQSCTNEIFQFFQTRNISPDCCRVINIITSKCLPGSLTSSVNGLTPKQGNMLSAQCESSSSSVIPALPGFPGSGSSNVPTLPGFPGSGSPPVPTLPGFPGSGSSNVPTLPGFPGSGSPPVPTLPGFQGSGSSNVPTLPGFPGSGSSPVPTLPGFPGSGSSNVPTLPGFPGSG